MFSTGGRKTIPPKYDSSHWIIFTLTSGGENSPGMNCATRAVVRAGLKYGLEVLRHLRWLQRNGRGNIKKLDRSSVSDIVNRGGTILQTARLPEFKQEAVRQIASSNLRNSGSMPCRHRRRWLLYGRQKADRNGHQLRRVFPARSITISPRPTTRLVSIPASTRSSSASIRFGIPPNPTQRCAIIEVMGNHCGDLALFSGLAEGAEMIITPDHPIPEDEIMANLKAMHKRRRNARSSSSPKRSIPISTLSPTKSRRDGL
jgi:6-phosphofructokinase 1